MATDLSTVSSFPYFHKESGVSNLTTLEIKLPESANQVSIGSDSAFVVAINGATDGGAVPAHYAFGIANNYLQMDLSKGLQGSNSVFVAGSGGAVDIYIILEK